jgi:hypothetical protein
MLMHFILIAISSSKSTQKIVDKVNLKVFLNILNVFQEKMIGNRMISCLNANVLDQRGYSPHEQPNRSS